jgi:hypothetical protein
MSEQLGTNPKDKLGMQKVSLTKVSPASMIYEALAMMDGAKKYDPYNWRENKVILSIYLDAAMRHIFAFWDGEELAPDSQVPHLGHAKACLGVVIDALETGNLVDDRPKPGATAKLLEKYTTKKPKDPLLILTMSYACCGCGILIKGPSPISQGYILATGWSPWQSGRIYCPKCNKQKRQSDRDPLANRDRRVKNWKDRGMIARQMGLPNDFHRNKIKPGRRVDDKDTTQWGELF